MESKKKNIMSSETEAPRGRHMAWIESNVVTLDCSFLSPSFSLSSPRSSRESDLNEPYTMRRMDMKNVDTRLESMML